VNRNTGEIMAKTVRTVRFTEDELKRIDLFLKQNPVFDFSRLVRHALDQFLENPGMTIRPVKKASQSRKQRSSNAEI
jgi:hypothetical protein